MLGPVRCPVSVISDSAGEVGEPDVTQAACEPAGPAGPGTIGPPFAINPVSGRAWPPSGTTYPGTRSDGRMTAS
jgi:hypothetical protein